MNDSRIVANFGRVGVELHGAERLRQRFVLPAQLDQRAGEPRPHLRIVRRERRRLAQAVLRADQIVHVQQRSPEVEVSARVARVVSNCGFVARNRRLPLLAFLKQVAEAVVGDGNRRVSAQQAAVQVDGEVGAAALAGHGCEQMQRVGLLRHRVEHPPGELLRLAQVPGAVGVEGAPQPSIGAGIGAGMSRAARWSALLPSAHAGFRQVSGTGRRTPAASTSDRPRSWTRTERSRLLPAGAKRGPNRAARRARWPEPARPRMRRVP